MNFLQKTSVFGSPPVTLTNRNREALKAYFDETWRLYEWLFSSIQDESTYYLNPDPLRHPLIFYWGHTACFYVNKLRMAGLMNAGIDEAYEVLFAKGVDPDLPKNLDTQSVWPTVAEVDAYRQKVYDAVVRVIATTELPDEITAEHPLWALHMGLEHDRIHFETSSVLIRQLDSSLVQKPEGWEYAPTLGAAPEASLIEVPAGEVCLGKGNNNIFGWDNEYGTLRVQVQAFAARQTMVTNAEYLEFVESGGYNEARYWAENAWEWKEKTHTKHPKFWVKEGAGFRYRAMFDVLEMPLDWPVEVNAYEAWAYCQWKGEGWRLMTEAEYNRIGSHSFAPDYDPVFSTNHNLHVKFGSPNPVGYLAEGQSPLGFHDVYGNVWEWLSDDFYPLPGFKVHPYYEDFSAAYFDEFHSMMLGGSWASLGTSASKYYRLWFRKHFYQHAGFRLAKDL